ncbi:biopolymer transporter ExbD [Oscillatoria sp. FACHB-1406]|uniref:ExbD/TolR family protein n=1 Tax=Oscillatoria sp. FACHB-1406 TaxID=2692846 RepID=UPI001682A04A|nr:biopolymer transporter ExbD [Oscillatoria sp. FACHB-1406]MBD2576259.1 biopolymer transporter ExbD [Oscillatoria sp. FACHB-1406]
MSQKKPRKKPSRAALSLAMRPFNLRLDNSTEQDMRVEIIPLIDVIFCILVFFLLAAVDVSRQRAIGLDLPKASTGEAQRPEQVLVSLDYAGQIYIEQQPVADDRLYQAVESYFQRRPDTIMLLYASKDVRYDRVMQVLDVLRQVGGRRVALATLPQNAQQSTLANPAAPLPGTLPTNPVSPYPNPEDPSGALPLPGVSPAVPGLPTPPNSTQPALPNLPSVPPTQATPNIPVAPSDNGTPPSEQ